jgi:hypothetical protein
VGGVEAQLLAFLTLTVDESEWSGLLLYLFYFHGNSIQYPVNRRLVGPQGQNGYFGKERIFCLYSELNQILQLFGP